MFSPDYYRCSTCGKVTWTISGSPAPIICCGEPMTKLTAGESDGPSEKHIPSVTLKKGILHVQIGSVLHPVTGAHHIEWIALLTDTGIYFSEIPLGELPAADFSLGFGTPVSVFAYCNIHGLWKTDIHQ